MEAWKIGGMCILNSPDTRHLTPLTQASYSNPGPASLSVTESLNPSHLASPISPTPDTRHHSPYLILDP